MPRDESMKLGGISVLSAVLELTGLKHVVQSSATVFK